MQIINVGIVLNTRGNVCGTHTQTDMRNIARRDRGVLGVGGGMGGNGRLGVYSVFVCV